MANLALESLLVKSYRGLSDVRIEQLGRVNLITGKNNVGKTSLLEALFLFANSGQPEAILSVITGRDEHRERGAVSRAKTLTEVYGKNIRHLFYGRPDLNEAHQEIEIGELFDSANRLTIKLEWFRQLEEEDSDDSSTFETRLIPLASEEVGNFHDAIPRLVVRSKELASRFSLSRIFRSSRNREILERDIGEAQFFTAGGLKAKELGRLWDSITLTPQEEQVLECLRIISPDIERVSFVGDDGVTIGRLPIVKLKGRQEPVPIKSMGEGINRLFGISLSLLSAKNGMLLLDEIESGLHYTVQPDLWRFIFKIATNLSVQVFAITHSYDCVRSFAQAAEENPECGIVIRLDKKDESVSASLFDEPELSLASDYNIEVR